MNSISIWIAIGALSGLFGIFSRVAVYKPKSVAFWFFEVWRDAVSYFVAGVAGYFLVAIRWPIIAQSGSLLFSDFIVCLILFVGVLGWWPYVIKNITEGIGAILSKIMGISK